MKALSAYDAGAYGVAFAASAVSIWARNRRDEVAVLMTDEQIVEAKAMSPGYEGIR